MRQHFNNNEIVLLLNIYSRNIYQINTRAKYMFHIKKEQYISPFIYYKLYQDSYFIFIYIYLLTFIAIFADIVAHKIC